MINIIANSPVLRTVIWWIFLEWIVHQIFKKLIKQIVINFLSIASSRSNQIHSIYYPPFNAQRTNSVSCFASSFFFLCPTLPNHSFIQFSFLFRLLAQLLKRNTVPMYFRQRFAMQPFVVIPYRLAFEFSLQKQSGKAAREKPSTVRYFFSGWFYRPEIYHFFLLYFSSFFFVRGPTNRVRPSKKAKLLEIGLRIFSPHSPFNLSRSLSV